MAWALEVSEDEFSVSGVGMLGAGGVVEEAAGWELGPDADGARGVSLLDEGEAPGELLTTGVDVLGLAPMVDEVLVDEVLVATSLVTDWEGSAVCPQPYVRRAPKNGRARAERIRR